MIINRSLTKRRQPPALLLALRAFGSAERLIRALVRLARIPQHLPHSPRQLLAARTPTDVRVYPYVEWSSV